MMEQNGVSFKSCWFEKCSFFGVLRFQATLNRCFFMKIGTELQCLNFPSSFFRFDCWFRQKMVRFLYALELMKQANHLFNEQSSSWLQNVMCDTVLTRYIDWFHVYWSFVVDNWHVTSWHNWMIQLGLDTLMWGTKPSEMR